MTQLPHRHNNKWTINELLSLQREYELLEMSIQQIANKHGRTIEAILFKLQSEKFISSWIDAKGYQDYSKSMSSLTAPLTTFLEDEYGIIDYNYNYDGEHDSDYDGEHESSSDYNLESDSETDTTNNLVVNHLFNNQISNITSSINDIKCMLTSLLSNFNSSSEKTL